MKYEMFERLKLDWIKCSETNDAPWKQTIKSGKLGIAQYKSFLLETYHETALNPQVQAWTTAFLNKENRQLIKRFYSHASSEVGHDLLALEDLVALGVARERVERSVALPETQGLVAWPFFQVQFRNPIGYLGYLFHLEMLPMTTGSKHVELLMKNGVPEKACQFLKEHSQVDEYHVEAMRGYMNELVTGEELYGIVRDSMEATMVLHNRMIDAAFQRAEREGDRFLM